MHLLISLKRMGLTIWKNAPDGKIFKPDVTIAKSYLIEVELKSLSRFVTMYLDYGEDIVSRNIPMTMKDQAEKLNAFLQETCTRGSKEFNRRREL